MIELDLPIINVCSVVAKVPCAKDCRRLIGCTKHPSCKKCDMYIAHTCGFCHFPHALQIQKLKWISFVVHLRSRILHICPHEIEDVSHMKTDMTKMAQCHTVSPISNGLTNRSVPILVRTTSPIESWTYFTHAHSSLRPQSGSRSHRTKQKECTTQAE